MPKNEIDYSNTIIYKITCFDPNITHVYVGHTTNFVQRKHSHKTSCINEKSVNYKCKLYETIRCNGGWCNWKMEIINFFNCANHYEARQKEQEYFTLLNANLNSIEPLPKPKIKTNVTPIKKTKQNSVYCQSCNVYLKNIQLLEIHNNTKKHIKMCNTPISLDNKLKSYNYECEKCHYTCSKNSDYIKHLSTNKHIQQEQLNNKNENNHYLCECGKQYNYHSGLWKHKKNCQDTEATITQPLEELVHVNELSTIEIIELLKAELVETRQLTKIIMEQSKQMMEQSKQMMELLNNNQSK